MPNVTGVLPWSFLSYVHHLVCASLLHLLPLISSVFPAPLTSSWHVLSACLPVCAAANWLTIQMPVPQNTSSVFPDLLIFAYSVRLSACLCWCQLTNSADTCPPEQDDPPENVLDAAVHPHH
jgi:hypothetical protein